MRTLLALAHGLVTSAFALALASCGPVRSSTLVVDAAAELAAARTAQADELSPFEFTAADAYYHKALEEQSRADFDRSVRFATKSLDCARLARAMAEAQTRAALGASALDSQKLARCRPGPDRAVPLLDAVRVPNAASPAAPAPSEPIKGPPGKAPQVRSGKAAAESVETTEDAALPEGDAAPDAEAP